MNSQQSFYPGNRDLPAEVKDRVSMTFRQAVELFRQGRIDEVQHGCDLILQMDGAFVPARKLLEKLRNPAAPVDIESLTAGLPGGEDRLMAARQAVAERDFRRAVDLSNEILHSDLTNTEAQNICQLAQERIEAAPFVEQFLVRARTHLAAGNLQAARGDIDKARTLDADHPMIRQIENTLATMPVNVPPPPDPGASAPPFPPTDPGVAFDLHAGDPEGSFIVETPAGGRARGAQASDFGFSFEEDHSHSADPVAFGSAAEGAIAPEVNASFSLGEAQTFDFSTAPVEQSTEDEHRIQQYLDDGDQALAAGDPQRATEIWSRIFLIDVTHPGASERIERARRMQLELDKQIDAIETEANALHAAGRTEEARAGFEEILRLDPGNESAAKFLNSLGTEEPTDLPELTLEEPPPLAAEYDPAAYGLPADMALESLDEAPTLQSSRTPRVPARSEPEAKPAKRRLGALVVVGAILLLFGAGYLALSRLGGGRPTAASPDSDTILMRAGALASQGRYDQAIDLLSSISANDANRDEALAMIAELRKQKGVGSQTVDGRPAAQVHEELLMQARNAFAARDYLKAKESFDRAARIRPLPAEVMADYQLAQQQVAKLASALAHFKEGTYHAAIEVLQGLSAEDPDNVNVRQLLNNAHFNLGVSALREDNLAAAISEFDSVLANDPNDEAARRSREIAIRYRDQAKDLLFRIYVKYLPLR